MEKNKTAQEIAAQYRKKIPRATTIHELAKAIKFKGLWEEVASFLKPKLKKRKGYVDYKTLMEWGEYFYDDDEPIK